MNDNPNLTGQDRKTVSSQPHEIEYLTRKLREAFPGASPEDVRYAIEVAKKDGATQREEVIEKARAALQSAAEPGPRS